MTLPACPDCGGHAFYVSKGTGKIPIFVECAAWSCHWTQEPSTESVILAALETYRRNQPKEAA